MGPLKALIGAAVGGAIGAGVWAAVVYNFEVEISWIAIGVGLLCGLGAALAAKGDTDSLTGGIAALVAVASIAGGKYLAVHYTVQQVVKGVGQVEFGESDAQMYMAHQVMEEYASNGLKLNWPEGKDADSVETIEDYPADLRKDVSIRWEGMSVDERERYRSSVKASLDHEFADAMGDVESEGFFAMFEPLDILFVLLAIFSAYKVGSGNIGGDD